MKTLLINLINFYQKYLSFDTGVLAIFTPNGVCRYPITCSEYTKRAVAEFGVVKGSLMGLKRIGSCR